MERYSFKNLFASDLLLPFFVMTITKVKLCVVAARSSLWKSAWIPKLGHQAILLSSRTHLANSNLLRKC